MKKEIINKLFPEEILSISEIEKKYPPRKLKEGAMVTRFAPSPTGFMHLGGLYSGLISERFAHQTDGIFYLRIEDTDQKREVEGATELIINSLNYYGLVADEGPTLSGKEIGYYGPYKQSERGEIYKAYVKKLLEKDLAYPCFCSPEELEEIRLNQESKSIRTGYYKEYAVWRNKSELDILHALEQNIPFVIRFKSHGNFDNKIIAQDILRGTRELSENDQDIVILKSSGLPTYHFAHVVDDKLMGTTHVLRGEEWFSSLPLHLQLFQAMEWQTPNYGHLLPIQKMEGSSKRKLSKRKDPEANVVYYEEQGYPKDAVIEYLLNLANSDFEDWRKANLGKNNKEFILSMQRLSHSSGPLFDLTKLNDISKEVIGQFSAEEIFEKSLKWAKIYDKNLAHKMEQNSDYVKQIFNIERVNTTKVRKDIAKWSDIRREIEYFFDDTFNLSTQDIDSMLASIDKNDIKSIINSFMASYDVQDSKEIWFDKIKQIAIKHNYAENTKAFKANPGQYKGYVADVAKILRVLVTGRIQSPDLHAIMQILGRDRVFKRLKVLG
ncbi:MAG: glutamate--tRNA ligase [Candidatus Babeliales bacterium]